MDRLSKIRVSFLISGYGSNLSQILNNIQKDRSSNFIPTLIVSNKNIINKIKIKSKEINESVKILENVANLNEVNFLNSDLIFSIGYMRQIPKSIFNKFLTINLHPSILPVYKGLMTHKRMVINNEKKYGETHEKVVVPRHRALTMILMFSCEHPFLHEKGPEQISRALNTNNLRQKSLRVFFMLRETQKIREKQNRSELNNYQKYKTSL